MPKLRAYTCRKWSEGILTEVRNTLTGKLAKTSQQADHLIAQMTDAFPEALVTGYQYMEAAMTNEVKDRHVLAAAVRCGAQTIVTFNTRHFQKDCLITYDVEAIHPDEFLVNQFSIDDALVIRKFTEQANAIGRTIEEQLDAFQKSRALPLFTQTVADTLGIRV